MATYTQRFRNFDSEFVARGRNPKRLAVFKIVDGKERLAAHATFPACLKFMPDAEPVGDLVVEN